MFSTIRTKIESLPEKRLRVFASVLITMSIVDLLLAIAFALLGVETASYFMIILVIGFACFILPLLLFGYHLAARLITPYFAVIVLFLFGSYYGPGVNPWSPMLAQSTRFLLSLSASVVTKCLHSSVL